MGAKNYIDIELAKLELKNWVQDLLPILELYFKQLDKVDLVKTDPTSEISFSLASILQRKIYLDDDNCGNLCADDVLAKQIIIEKDSLMKFWGIIYWL